MSTVLDYVAATNTLTVSDNGTVINVAGTGIDNNFSVPQTFQAGISASGSTSLQAVSGTTGTFTGAVSVSGFSNAGSTSLQAVSGTTGTFTGAVSVSGFSNAGSTSLQAGILQSGSAGTGNQSPLLNVGDAFSDFIADGMQWAIPSSASLTTSMASGTAYLNSVRTLVPAVSGYSFPASNDTYVSFNNAGQVDYQSVANGATAPTPNSGYVQTAKVVTSPIQSPTATLSTSTSGSLVSGSYGIALVAFDATGYGAVGASGTVTVTSAQSGSGSIEISWVNPLNETSMDIYATTAGSTTLGLVASGVTGTSYTYTGSTAPGAAGPTTATSNAVQSVIPLILFGAVNKRSVRLNVLDFGADPTGAADSSVAFQAAIDALPDLGGYIGGISGNFVLNTPLNVGNKSIYWDVGVNTNFSGEGIVPGTFPYLSTNSLQMAIGPFIQSRSSNIGGADNNGGVQVLGVEMLQPESVTTDQSVAIYAGAQGSSSSSGANIWAANFLINALAGFGGTAQGIEVDVNSFSDSVSAVIKGISINGVGTNNPHVGMDIVRSDSSYWILGIDLRNCGTGMLIPNNDGNLENGIGINGFNLPSLISGKQISNGGDSILLQRNSDTNPAGYFFRCVNAENSENILLLDIFGNLTTNGAIIGAPATNSQQMPSLGQLIQILIPSSGSIAPGDSLVTLVFPNLTAAETFTLEPANNDGQRVRVYGGEYELTISSSVTSGAPALLFPDNSISYSYTLGAGTSAQYIEFMSDGANWVVDVVGKPIVVYASASNEALPLGQANSLYQSSQLSVSSTAASGSITATATQLVGGYLADGATQVAAFTVTTDTAANILAQMPNATIGTSFKFRFINNDQSATGYAGTLAGGTGVTIGTVLPNPAVPKGGYEDYVFTFTAVGATAALTVEAVGGSSAALL